MKLKSLIKTLKKNLSLELGVAMTIEFYPEICCDYCNEVIHNHFDCPVCNEKYASTSLYGEIDDYYKDFTCEECNAKFILVKEIETNTWECNV